MIEQSEVDFYRLVLPECDIVFDVGCGDDNIFYELKPDLAQIHLFDPRRLDFIEKRIQGKPNITFNNYALGNFTGTTEFHYKYQSIMYMEGRRYPEVRQGTRTVPVDTLHNYCKARGIDHIDLLKIDTERYDFEVIKGVGKSIPIKFIQFEEWRRYYGDVPLRYILKILRRRGYIIYRLIGSNNNFVASKREIPEYESSRVQ